MPARLDKRKIACYVKITCYNLAPKPLALEGKPENASGTYTIHTVIRVKTAGFEAQIEPFFASIIPE
jgi:hypothetical protein